MADEVILNHIARARDLLDAAPIPDNVQSLAEARAMKAGDNRLWSSADCLAAAQRDLQPEQKVVVLIIDMGNEDEPNFDVTYTCAGIKASQILAALECCKFKVLRQMGYLDEE
jgi:hypothetical protein